MSQSRFTTRQMATAGIIAAVYAALTLLLPIPQYGGIQFRVAEAMTVLPFFFPEAIPGLAVGCFLANLLGSTIVDVIFGTLATLLACIATQHMPNRYLASLPPVIFNMIIVGAEIAWFETGFGPGFWPAYAFNAVTVGVGELAACFILGQLLLSALPRVESLRPYIPEKRLNALVK